MGPRILYDGAAVTVLLGGNHATASPNRLTPSSSDREFRADGPPRSSPSGACASCCSSAARTSSIRRTIRTPARRPWEYPYRAGRTRAMVDAYPVLRRDYPLNEKNLDWWVNEQESPYTEVKRFDWYRGYHLGGRSLTWGRQSYRLSDLDFEANVKEGIAIDWPVRYADIAPWYDHVEKHAGISGSIEGLPQLPDGQFQPAMPLNCAEETVAGRVAKRFAEPPDHSRPRREPDAAAAGPRPLPVSQRVRARLSVGLVLQHAGIDAAVCDGDRPIDAQDRRDRHRRGLRRRPQARHRRAGDGCADQRHDRIPIEGGVPLRVDAELDVAADALGDRRLAGRTRQQLRRARAQPDGSSLPLRRERHFRGAKRSRRLRAAAERLLHPALQEPVRRQARLPARLRLPGLGQPPGMAARDRGARRRRGVQGRGRDAGTVADRRRRASARCCRTTPTGSRSTR